MKQRESKDLCFGEEERGKKGGGEGCWKFCRISAKVAEK